MFRWPVALAALTLTLALVATAPALAAAPAAPEVDAVAYVLIDPAGGETLAAQTPDRRLAMASTTKIMTALVTMENADLDDVFTVPPAAERIGGSSGALEAGERLTVRRLLTALLVASGNDAAVTLARGVAGSPRRFVALMNRRAGELGLTMTRFANPHGLDAPGHHASARDLVTLAEEAMRDPVFRDIVSARRASIPGPGGVGRRTYESENALLDLDPDADGVKTGVTDDAGYSIVAHARRPRLGVELYLAMIGSPDSDTRARDAKRLLDWGFSRYARAAIVPEGGVVGRMPVDGRPGVEVPYGVRSELAVPVRLNGTPVSETLVAPAEVTAPVSAGQVLGTITVRQGTRVLGRRELVATEGAGAPSPWDRFRDGLEALIP